MLVMTSFLCPAISINAQRPIDPVDIPIDPDVNKGRIFAAIEKQAASADLTTLLEKIFGGDAAEAASSLGEGSTDLLVAVTNATDRRAEELLDNEITKRRERKVSAPVVTPQTKKSPVKRVAPRTGRRGFVGAPPRFDWRQIAFGFQSLPSQDEKPEIKMTETDKEIKAEGTNKKAFETKDAKGTRTQKAETRYIKDGKTFGTYIKNMSVIEAVSKPDGKSFRQELTMEWGAEVAACPDVDGVTTGTGKAKATSKTTYTENGEIVAMTADFDLQAKMKGFVNDQAEFRYYDFEVDAYVTSSGQEDAFRRKLIKELKLKDGRYGLHLDIPHNTIEVSDGTYGGNRTPAKMGKIAGRLLTEIPNSDAKTVGESIGPMIPSIWISANDMYKSAQQNWKNGGCVEVRCKVAKTTIEPGETIDISTETVHLHDGSKVNAELEASGYEADVSPEGQSGRPGATFTYTQTGKESASFSVKSISKRGIGGGDVDFNLTVEKETASGNWSGTIKAERKVREEREKRSGANLAENGGHLTTTTNVQIQIDGRLDRTVDANNAYIANVSGTQETVDYEYDRYKIDEGYCGPSAVPYKGPKEITRTSTTTATYAKETRAYVEIGPGGGTITFSLPDIDGTTVHKYVHKSPCSEHDRVNTNETTDENSATIGGSFSFSFPIGPDERSIKGSITIPGENGSTTTYTWELSRL